MNKEQVLLDAPSIELENGEKVVDYCAHGLTPLGQKGIVYVEVLRHLASLLPLADSRQIVNNLISSLEEAKNKKGGGTLEEAVGLCKKFVMFHETVNLIKTYDESPKIIGKVEIKEEEREVDFS